MAAAEGAHARTHAHIRSHTCMHAHAGLHTRTQKLYHVVANITANEQVAHCVVRVTVLQHTSSVPPGHKVTIGQLIMNIPYYHIAFAPAGQNMF
jgi:hypothetical protein